MIMPPTRSRGANRSSASPARQSQKRGAAEGPQPDLPYGQSILPALMAQDPTPTGLQAFYCLVSFCGVALLPFYPTMAAHSLGADASWDALHPGDLKQLLSDSIGASAAEIDLAAWTTAAVYLALFIADVLSQCAPATIRWPVSWHCENTMCYEEMFCEPTRASLVRRPGNTFSNFPYLFGALLILPCAWRASPSPSPFWVADAMFGAMLLALATLSTIWHASNAPKSQYVDLWAVRRPRFRTTCPAITARPGLPRNRPPLS